MEKRQFQIDPCLIKNLRFSQGRYEQSRYTTGVSDALETTACIERHPLEWNHLPPRSNS
jgi:hypothetical protein